MRTQKTRYSVRAKKRNYNWENMKLKSGNYLTRLAPRTDSSDTLLKKLRASLFTSESETLKGLEKERGFLEQSV